MKRTALAAIVGLMGVSALPAAAHPTGPKANHSTGSSCAVRHVAYRVKGTFVSSSLTQDPTTGLFSGTITVHVTSANHAARATKGNDTVFTLTAVKLTVASDVTAAGGPTAGPPADQVTVKATITKLRNACPTGGFTPSVTVKHVVVNPPADETT